MFNILIMFIAFSTQQRNEVHNNTCCVFVSNINSHVLNFKVLRDYFVIKQNKNNKTETPLCSTSLGMDKNNLCTSHCIHSS